MAVGSWDHRGAPYPPVAKAVDLKTGASPIRAYAISQGTMPIGSANFGDRSLRAEFLQAQLAGAASVGAQ